MSLLLKLPIFEDVNKYIEQELKTRYSQLIDKFFYDLDCVITIDQRRKLNEYFNSLVAAALDVDADVAVALDADVDVAVDEMGENVGTKELGIKELGIKELGIKELGIKKLGIKELGIKELGIKELGIKELGIKELGIKELGIKEQGNIKLEEEEGEEKEKEEELEEELGEKGAKLKLANKYYLNINVKLDPYYSTYNCTRVEENSLNRCQARTSNGTQCTRAHNNTVTKLCGSHMRANPHGVFGGSNPLKEAKLERRLQNSHKTVKNLKGIDISEYIKTTEIELDGKTYLLDDNGILYDLVNFNILAHIKDYKVYWFTS